MTTITLKGCNNTTYNLTAPGSPVTVLQGGISGLIGKPESVASQDSRFPGQVLHHLTTPPLEGSLTLCVDKSVGFRAIVSTFSPLVPAVLSVDAWSASLRLAGAIDPPAFDPDDEPDIDVTVPLVGDHGAWFGKVQSSPRVVNDGDIPILPWFEWVGEASVVLPSGLILVLPRVDAVHTLKMSLATGNSVWRGGQINHDLTSLLPSFVEFVPPGTTKEFGLNGARIFWQKGKWNPWT